MAKKVNLKKPIKSLTENDLGVYINLLTDFGFKRVFGIKEVLLEFLNSVLDVEGGIKDLQYCNPEKLGFSQYERKAVYDLYCVSGEDKHFIVEIQSVPQIYFIDRTVLYVSRLINSQSVKGKDWNFELPKVYSLNILDFTFEEAMLPLEKEVTRNVKNKFVSKVQLLDCETKELFYDKLTFIYIELPRFTKKLKNLKTFFEQWIYIIKHLHELKGVPKKFRKEKVFESLFEIAQIARMTKKEVNNYLKDLNNMNIVKNEIRTRDDIIARLSTERDNAWIERDNAWNTIAQKDNELSELQCNNIALQGQLKEYEKRFGNINGTKVL